MKTIESYQALKWPVRAAKRAWKPALGLFLLFAAVTGAATYVTGGQLEDEITKIKARGEYVSCAELAGPAIPDSENGALLYEQAFTHLLEPSSDATECDRLASPVERSRDPSVWAKAEAELPGYSEAIALAEQAQSMPRCRFKTNWQDGYAAEFPYCTKLRGLARVLAADALIKAKNGDGPGAAHALRMLFALQDSIKDDPTMISVLVRAAITSIGSSTLSDVAQMLPLPEADAERLSDYLGKVDLRLGFINALLGERALVLYMFDAMQKNTEKYLDEVGMTGPEKAAFVRRYFTPVGRPNLYREELGILKCWEQMLAISEKPYREAKNDWAALGASVPARAGKLGELFIPNFPAFSRARADTDRDQVRLNACRILLAMNVHKARTGAYPESLDNLESTIHWNLNLEDTFTGNQLIYKRQGSGCLLYSIGEDMKDDGGKEENDLVWKMDK